MSIDNKDSSDKTHLTELYPKAKTYEERRDTTTLRQQTYRSRWPKYPFINIAAYGSIIFGLAVWFIQNIHTWWFGSSQQAVAMTSIFFSFLMAITLTLLLILWVNYVNKLFAYFNGMTGLFWILYSIMIAGLCFVWSNSFIWNSTDAWWIPSLVTLHFIILVLKTQRLLHYK